MSFYMYWDVVASSLRQLIDFGRNLVLGNFARAPKNLNAHRSSSGSLDSHKLDILQIAELVVSFTSTNLNLRHSRCNHINELHTSLVTSKLYSLSGLIDNEQATAQQ